MGDITQLLTALTNEISELPFIEKVSALNTVREALHKISPFANEPIDLVRWVKAETVSANDYNPNKVAPPEMRLLEHSIREDGYTQPIVAYAEDGGQHTVVDGFHRNEVGRAALDIQSRLHGYLPITIINPDRTNRSDRIAATIRHNRARGRHMVAAMADIVVELAKRNWDDKKIARELGMDPDEVLRLKQIGGLAELFANREFSEAWDTQ
ncbi:MAG: IbrB-like domain-containing protein [Alphaproteobacteria bacterium]